MLRFGRLQDTLVHRNDALAGNESVFVGQFHGGEIYNQYPQECWLEGTRRWLPGTRRTDVENQLRQVVDSLARETGTTSAVDLFPIRDAFLLDQSHPFVGLATPHGTAHQYTITGLDLSGTPGVMGVPTWLRGNSVPWFAPAIPFKPIPIELAAAALEPPR